MTNLMVVISISIILVQAKITKFRQILWIVKERVEPKVSFNRLKGTCRGSHWVRKLNWAQSWTQMLKIRSLIVSKAAIMPSNQP